MIRKNTFVLQSVDIAVDLPLKVRHAPTPVDQEEADGQDDLQTGPGINQLTNDFLKMGQPGLVFDWDYIHIKKESLTCDRRSKQPNTCDRYFAILPIGIDRLLAKTEAQRYVTLRGSSSSRRWKTWSSASPREGFSCFLWKQFGQF